MNKESKHRQDGREPYVAPLIDVFYVKSPHHLLGDFSVRLEDGIDDALDLIEDAGGVVGDDAYFND